MQGRLELSQPGSEWRVRRVVSHNKRNSVRVLFFSVGQGLWTWSISGSFSGFIDGCLMVSSSFEVITYLLGMPLVVCLVGAYASESQELAVGDVFEDVFWMA